MTDKTGPRTEAATFPGQASAPDAPPAERGPGETSITVSRGLGQWLKRHRLSFAFSSYQTGQLFLVGLHPNGTVSFNQQNYSRAMGLSWQPGRLYLGTMFQLWRLENVLRPGELANDAFDTLLVPRNAQTTGDLDIHEVGVDRAGAVLFVNTKYSCIAGLDLTYSFRPVWTPPFISKLAPEDRCHLNGMAMAEGEVRYATAVSRSDIVSGWRERRHEGGVLIEVPSGRIVSDRLSMPHSPRVYGDGVLVLDSGRGWLVRIDPRSGERTDIAFCPGFLRGLAVHGGHALVTVSKPRDGTFKHLLLDGELRTRDAEAWCGVLVIDLASGAITEWLRLDGHITELFDVTAMPGVTCPMAIGPQTAEMHGTVTFET